MKQRNGGDLPFQGRGHFYISLNCQSHPEMTTALAEDATRRVRRGA